MTNNSLSERLRTKTRKFNYAMQAVVLSFSAAVPILMSSGTAHGAQLTSRSIDMSGNATSEGSGRDGGDAYGQDVTYRVSFTIPTTGNVGGLVIDFCNSATGPITGTACTAPTGFDINKATLALANQSGITDWSIDTGESSASLLVLNRTAASVTGPQAIVFDLGTSAASDGITNPTTTGTFYARILTFATDTAADNYTSTVPGSYVDDGGIALATANELTITARVQEQLQFCVGTTDANSTNNCADISGTSVSLGVVDSSTVAATGDAAGLAMIRTNAFNGATIRYKAEQETSSGQLKVAGATCSGTLTDQCFNSTGTTQNTISAGSEEFGMTITDVDTTNGNTTNLQCDTQYDGDGTCDNSGTYTDYAWDDSGAFDTVASSTGSSVKVIDDEMINMKFAATAEATTPTGLYSVTANFVATATF